MRKSRALALIVTICFIIFSVEAAQAHDWELGKRQNHYDYMVIGIVENIDEQQAELVVHDYIVSRENCSHDIGKRNHIPPKKLKIKNAGGVVMRKGAMVLAIVGEAHKSHEQYWTEIYEVDSLDYKTLNIIYPEMNADIAALNDFVNSGGNITGYSHYDGEGNYYNGQRVYRHDSFENKEYTLIYSPETGRIAQDYSGFEKVIKPDNTDTGDMKLLLWVSIGVAIFCALTVKIKKRKINF